MKSLPIDPYVPDIVARLRNAGSLVLTAQPGAGKTTRIPPALINTPGALNSAHAAKQVLVLQPRRIAALATARRIADENGWELGRQVGYQVRREKCLRPDTPLRIMTEGILARQLLDDPALENVGTVVLDEFHERSIHSDVAVSLLRQIQQTIRPDLNLLVMSATLQAESVAKFLGNCPIIQVPGSTYPVKISYHAPPDVSLPQRVLSTMKNVIIDDNSGHILVFLPGLGEILRVNSLLEEFARSNDLELLMLHGSLSLEKQAHVLAESKNRKLILATNIAETSLTIDGISTVIDSGLARRAGFDSARGINQLQTVNISKASATQRAGRAGRTGPGRCIRLFSQQEEKHFADFDEPEILRLDLAPTVLTLYGWDPRGPEGVEWFESPLEYRVAAAQELLLELGAIKPIQNGLALTELGRKMTALPVHPRVACLLLAASEAHLAEHGALVAALLSEKDILKSAQKLRPQYSGDSDIQFRIDLFENWEHRRIDHLSELVDLSSVSRVAWVRNDLLRLISNVGATSQTFGTSTEETAELLLLAYPDRVCRRRPNDPTRGVMVGGKGVRIAPQSVVHHPELFIAVELEQTDSKGRGEAMARLVAGITQEMLQKHFRDQIRTERFVVWDPKTQNISALRRLSYRDLILNETADSNPQPEKVRAALFAAVGGHVREWINKNPSAATLILRLEFLRGSVPEKDWPEINDDLLMDLFSAQIHSTGHLPDIMAQVDWDDILLDGPLASIKRDLNQMAPTHIQLPSGRSTELEYRSSGPPILRAKVQELFSMADTPRVAAGRVRVLLEILGPNYRPVQVTDDLQGFWKRTYQNVRKDLRARYPKHAWPEDPTVALATKMKRR